MIHTDSAVLEIQVFLGKAAKLADSHPGFQQNNKLVVILGIGSVVPDVIHPGCELFIGQGNSGYRIVYHRIRQLEYKRILSDGILITGHLERRFDNAPHTGDGAVTSAVLLQLHKPQLGIGYLDGVDLSVAKVLFLD